ncbi:LysR family transcriptional regulator [Methylobacterium nodulans]|uniref:LysR family transcriptional regulator n=1 Tax=Methylobacterium nodulans TaxID=114616 RepID=UPI001FCA9B3E|nr:LysR family transcriptional regulator [Methylobacterium nodulans]
MSAASRALGVEHSTVARRVGQLETELQVRLFDRLARGWSLTSEGEALLRRAEAVEQEVLALRQAASGVDLLAGKVRISAPPLLLSHLILPGLRAFSSAHPGVTLELAGERRDADLARAEVDIAIRLGRPTEPDLVARPLGEISYGLYGLAEEIGRPGEEQVLVGFDDSMPDLPQKLWLDGHVAGRRFSVRSNDMATLLQAALSGFGIALLPDFLARAHDRLKALPLDSQAPVRPVFLVMHADIRRSQRVRLVADRVAQELAAALPV